MNRKLEVLILLTLTTSASAQVDNLRITEVDPATGVVEVTNLGPAFTPADNRPFCHLFDYQNAITPATPFAENGIETFTLVNLNSTASDLWIYRSRSFGTASEIVHGLQYGGGMQGRAGLASGPGVGQWSGADSYAPTPPAGMTLAWDGLGNSAFDWFIDETPSLGSGDVDNSGTVAPSQQFPAGVQDFEGLMLGDPVTVIQNWPVVDSSPAGAFTVRTVADVLGDITPRGDSNQWLRIHDTDLGAVQNRFYGPTIEALDPASYEWRFFVAAEVAPPATATSFPRWTIQHVDNGFVNTWGIEHREDGLHLIVTADGGTPGEALIAASTFPDDLGAWLEIALTVDFEAGTVSATIDGGTPAALPIAPPTADPARFRFCYRGEGEDNVGTFLLDDVGITVIDADFVFANSFEE
ncbi:MAG: hypothetical protein AAGA23_22060 [Pseudomonadota bacterium]